MLQEGKLPPEVGKAPNIYVVNQDLDNQLQEHKRMIERMKSSHKYKFLFLKENLLTIVNSKTQLIN